MLIKICGMRDAALLELAASLGVNMCGFIFHSGSPRYVSPREVASLPDFGMKRVGVFTCPDANEIMAIMKMARLDFAQLHGGQDSKVIERIGADRVIRVLWPQKYANLPTMIAEARKKVCAYYLLDAGTSGGGHGHALAWNRLCNLELPGPWLLAGGLTAENVCNAIKTCRPEGVDLNSGLESSPGVKDAGKIISAVNQLRLQEEQ